MSYNRSIEVLRPDFMWDSQTPDQICEIFEKCLQSRSQLQTAWESWRGKPTGDTPDWHPGLYVREREFCEYATYFPAIINQATASRRFVTYNSNRGQTAPTEWLILPPLDFLPAAVNDVIAGAGGLLCVNGGLEPRSSQPLPESTPPALIAGNPLPSVPSNPTPPVSEKLTPSVPTEKLSLPIPGSPMPPIPEEIVSDEDDNLGLYPEQSVLLVCNPLTRETKIMPRHPRFYVKHKTARMVLVETSANAQVTLMPRLHFRLYVLGSHQENAETNITSEGISDIVILTYDSMADTWIACTTLGDARLPPHGRTDLAIVGDGFLVGGQATTGHSIRRTGGDVEHVWENKIFWVQTPLGRWVAFKFNVEGRGGRLLCVQAPRIVQYRSHGPVYAVTRPIDQPFTIEVFEVEIVSRIPTGAIRFVTCMPGDIFHSLFDHFMSHKPYDCTAGLHHVAFVVEHPDQQAVAVYDFAKSEWFMSNRPIERGQRIRHALARCDWTPNFAAKP